MQVETPDQLNLWMRKVSRSLPVSAACFVYLALWEFAESLHISPAVRSTLLGTALTFLIGNSISFLYLRYRMGKHLEKAK